MNHVTDTYRVADDKADSLNASVGILLLISTIIWISGNGLIPLLPVFAESLGADNGVIGLYLAFSYACLALGGLIASRFLRQNHRAVLCLRLTGLCSVPLIALAGQVQNIVQLTGLTALIWLLGGTGFAALNALLGQYAGRGNGGRIMGAMAATSPLGSVLGGLISGPIVDHWGFGVLFVSLAVVNVLWPLTAMWVRVPRDEPRGATASAAGSEASVAVPNAYRWRLLWASTFAYMVYYTSLLATSILMKDAGFSATAIASTAIWGGLVALPFSLGLARLSDRYGRKALWCVCQLLGMAGLLMLVFAQALWHFWLVAILIRFLSAGGRGISAAWMNDLYHLPAAFTSAGNPSPTPPKSQMLAALSSTIWVGGILGYLFFGALSQWQSAQVALLLAGVFLLFSLFTVVPIHTQRGRL